MIGTFLVWATGHALANLRRHPDLVINLASVAQVENIEAIAATTGSDPVPSPKRPSYRHVHDKWRLGGFTQAASVEVAPARIAESPVQLEARVARIHDIGEGNAVAVEAAVVRAHAHTDVLTLGPRRPGQVSYRH